MQVILTQQPALFDRAFRKLFSEEIAEAIASTDRHAMAADKQEPAAGLLQSFWNRHSSLPASLAPKAAVAPAIIQDLSRYETDFQVRSGQASDRALLHPDMNSGMPTWSTVITDKALASLLISPGNP